jgi:hypothetical protein
VSEAKDCKKVSAQGHRDHRQVSKPNMTSTVGDIAIVTLKDAATYILKHPKSAQQSPEWQAAGEAVIMAADDRRPLMHAHVGMMLVLGHGQPAPSQAPRRKVVEIAPV